VVPALAALLLAIAPFRAWAWPEPAQTFECRWTDSPVTLDGRPDDAAWNSAQLVDHFYLPWLGAASRPACSATKARVLWDREYLSFAAEMECEEIRTDAKARDEEAFGLFLKPADDKPGFYAFRANAAGSFGGLFLARRDAGGRLSFQDRGEFHAAV